MTRLGRPVADPVAGIGFECLLCGGHAHAYSEDGGHTVDVWELCRACNAAFEDLGQALEDVQKARARRVEVVAQVAGQLELEEEYLVPPFEDRLGDVLAAIRSGDWTGVDTMTIGDAVRHHADGFTRAELAEMRRVLGRRS